MGYREHTAEFLKAVLGGRGELDAWLECNNEAECRLAILGAIEEEREACEKAADSQWVKDPRISGGDAIRERSKVLYRTNQAGA